MTPRMKVGIGLVVIVTLAAVVAVGLRADAKERSSAAEVPAGNRCILCNTSGANQIPRICGSCNNKFSNRCILCNSYGAGQAPRICTSCDNKH